MKNLLIFAFIALPWMAFGQEVDVAVSTSVTDQNRTATLPFSSAISSKFDSIDLSTGNPSVRIPILHVKGRAGNDYDLTLRFEGNIWTQQQLAQSENSQWTIEKRNYIAVNGSNNGLMGWELSEPYMSNSIATSSFFCEEGQPNGTGQASSNYIFTDSDGGKHSLDFQFGSGRCSNGVYSYSYSGADVGTTGMWIGGPPNQSANTTETDDSNTVFNSSGDQFAMAGPTINLGGQAFFGMYGMANFTDPNGNNLQLYSGGADSLGRSLYSTTQPNNNELDIDFYDSNGNPQIVKLYIETISLSTEFGAPSEFGGDCYEATGIAYAVSSILLPNGQSYSFQYDSYGYITEMTLPTGGTIQYQWANLANGSITHRYLTSRSVSTGSASYTWQLALSLINPISGVSNQIQSIMTDPNGNQTVNQSQFGAITSSKVYNGTATGTPLRQYAVTYAALYNGYDLDMWNTLGLPTQVVTTLDNGFVSEVQYDYDTFTYPSAVCQNPGPGCMTYYDGSISIMPAAASRGNVLGMREYTYGQGAPSLVRQTINTFLLSANPNYFVDSSGNVHNVVNKIATSTVYDGSVTCYGGQSCSANQLSQVTYTYDGDGAVYRGRPTKVSKWLNTSSSALNTLYAYDTYGDTTSMTDPKGNVTSWLYSDTWAPNNGNCVPSSNTSAYVTQVTDAAGHFKKYTYEPCTGQAASYQDQNDISDSRPGTRVSYDLMDRVIGASNPNGGYTAAIYVDSAHTVEKQTYLSGTAPALTPGSVPANPSGAVFTDTLTSFDGLGRSTSVRTTDPEGDSYAVKSYDFADRTLISYNPYRSTSDSTYGSTAYTYDALGRSTLLTHSPDGSSEQWAYSGNVVTFTNEVGNQWQRTSDALGRLTTVSEPNGTSQSPSMVTNYTYDALSNLLSVAQLGGATSTGITRNRSFNYDSISRLLCSSNPENSTGACPTTGTGTYVAGTTGYTYDANGNVQTKTDARGVTTTDGYDALNRMLSKSYSDQVTPFACYQYDASSISGASSGAAGNMIGRLSNAWTLRGSGSGCSPSTAPAPPSAPAFLTLKSILAYDSMGRPTGAQQQQCIGSVCSASTPYSLNMAYDLAGNMTGLTNSVGAANQSLTLNNYFDAAARPCLTTATTGNSSWSTYYPGNLFQANPSTTTPGYAAFGGLQNWYMGSTSSTASTACGTAPASPINITQGYTNRLWVNSISATGQIP
jgi:YD repeat-containing protein